MGFGIDSSPGCATWQHSLDPPLGFIQQKNDFACNIVMSYASGHGGGAAGGAKRRPRRRAVIQPGQQVHTPASRGSADGESVMGSLPQGPKRGSLFSVGTCACAMCPVPCPVPRALFPDRNAGEDHLIRTRCRETLAVLGQLMGEQPRSPRDREWIRLSIFSLRSYTASPWNTTRRWTGWCSPGRASGVRQANVGTEPRIGREALGKAGALLREGLQKDSGNLDAGSQIEKSNGVHAFLFSS